MKFTTKDIEKAKELKQLGYNWVAVSEGGRAYVFERKPYRYKTEKMLFGGWGNSFSKWDIVSRDYFHSITWDDAPVSIGDIIASDNEKDVKIYRLTAECEEYKCRAKIAETVITELRTNLAKADKDAEIARLTSENVALHERLKKELPVKIGDIVYYIGFSTIPEDWEVECEVQEIRIISNEEYVLICKRKSTIDYCGISSDEFGKTWFIDPEKAKAELERRVKEE